MKCVNFADACEFVRGAGFLIQPRNETQDELLKLDRELGSFAQVRARLSMEVVDLPGFVLSAANLLPSNEDRLLWLERIPWSYPSVEVAVRGLRATCGEDPGLDEARGYFFGAENFRTQDIVELSATEITNVEVLASLICNVLLAGWEATLIARSPGTFISFWEGEIIVHSQLRETLDEATKLLSKYGLDRPS